MELYETVDSAMDAECAHLCIYCTLCVTAHAAVLHLDAAPYAAVRGILQTTEKRNVRDASAWFCTCSCGVCSYACTVWCMKLCRACLQLKYCHVQRSLHCRRICLRLPCYTACDYACDCCTAFSCACSHVALHAAMLHYMQLC